MPALADLIDGRLVALGDLPVLVRAADGERARAMAPVLAALPDDRRSPCIEVEYGGTAAPVPGRPPDETYGPLSLWCEDDVLHLSYWSGHVTATATANAIRAGGEGVDLADAWRFVFHYAAAHTLALHDRYLLHAGAIASGGRALIVTGASGSGKSTLVLAALEAGWSALSDDLVVVRRGPLGPEVCGIPKPFRVPSELLAGAGDADPRPSTRGRSEVDGFRWSPGWFPVRGPVTTGHNDAPHAELAPVPATAAVEIALAAFIRLGDARRLRSYFPLAAAIGAPGGHRLLHSNDPSARLVQAARALAPLRAP